MNGKPHRLDLGQLLGYDARGKRQDVGGVEL